MRLTVTLTLLFAASAIAAPPPLSLPASQFKIMTALFHGYGDPSFNSDLDAFRNGPQQQGQAPLYVSFGADGCFAGVFGEPVLANLDFACRAELSTWSLDHVFADIDRQPTDFGLVAGRPTVLVLIPSIVKNSCTACLTALTRAQAKALAVDEAAQLIEVDLIY